MIYNYIVRILCDDREDNMDLYSFIEEAIFEEKDKYTRLYELIWSEFEQDGFVITDEPGHEIGCICKATAIQNLIGEFEYRLYDEVNETDFEDVVDYLAQIGIQKDDIVAYCDENENIDTFDDDEDLKIKNGFDYITEIVADKLLECFSADDFVQDFTFEFEDVDEFLAFVDSNSERLDEYKEEYPSVLSWIESGMIV